MMAQQSLFGAEAPFGADISDCRRFRFLWWARLPVKSNEGSKHYSLLYVMLNPSTADEISGDHTIARCKSIALAMSQEHASKRQGPLFDRIEVVNLYSLRTAYPAILKQAGYPVVPERDDPPIQAAARRAGMIVYAFGNLSKEMLPRARSVDEMIRDARPFLQPGHLGLTQAGWPRHPSRLPGSPYPEPWSFPT